MDLTGNKSSQSDNKRNNTAQLQLFPDDKTDFTVTAHDYHASRLVSTSTPYVCFTGLLIHLRALSNGMCHDYYASNNLVSWVRFLLAVGRPVKEVYLKSVSEPTLSKNSL